MAIIDALSTSAGRRGTRADRLRVLCDVARPDPTLNGERWAEP
jgi:hypothetical protein